MPSPSSTTSHDGPRIRSSGIELRALAGGGAARAASAARSASGSSSERLAYAGESLSHGLLPGLVLAALAGAPLLLGAAGGALWRPR